MNIREKEKELKAKLVEIKEAKKAAEQELFAAHQREMAEYAEEHGLPERDSRRLDAMVMRYGFKAIDAELSKINRKYFPHQADVRDEIAARIAEKLSQKLDKAKKLDDEERAKQVAEGKKRKKAEPAEEPEETPEIEEEETPEEPEEELDFEDPIEEAEEEEIFPETPPATEKKKGRGRPKGSKNKK